MLRVALAVALGLSITGCGVEAEPPGAQSADIIEGTIAYDYPEAVHVNMFDEHGPSSRCSGTLIAPRVVLTAAHCIDGYTAWGIYAPLLGEYGQGAMATRAEVLDWTTGSTFDVDAHDVGVVLLDEDFILDRYPTLATVPVENGTKARIIGRTSNGFISPAVLFESEPVTLFEKFPLAGLDHEGYYFATKMVEKGDSGGPVFAEDPDRQEGEPRRIIGIVSTMRYMTRVDLVNDWIRSFLPEADD